MSRSIDDVYFHQLPSVDAGGPYTIDEGEELALLASGSDPNGDDITYSWDMDGDGVFDDATGSNPTLTWAQLWNLGITDDGEFAVTVQVANGRGEVATDSTTLTVSNVFPDRSGRLAGCWSGCREMLGSSRRSIALHRPKRAVAAQ